MARRGRLSSRKILEICNSEGINGGYDQGYRKESRSFLFYCLQALNGVGAGDTEAKAKIRRLASEMGYVPNQAAIHLKKSRSYVIGLYFSTISKMTSPYVLHDVLTGVYSITGSKYNVVVKGIDMHEPGTLNPSYYDASSFYPRKMRIWIL